MLVVAVVVAAAFGPAAAIALADGGSGGLSGSPSTPAPSSAGTTSAVTVTKPCSGSVKSTVTSTGPATTTTVPTTETVATTETVPTTETETVPATTTVGTTTTPADTTTTVDTTATVDTTETVPTTTTSTIPGTKTVTVTPACPPAPAPSTITVPKTNPFIGRAMWIWELPSSNGGNVGSIVARAKQYGIKTLYIKSSDGTGFWSQFSRSLVTELHEAGLKVCAWQYVYGVRPVVEANLGARAAMDGADCLIIDAESQYQGRYPAAQTYMTQLRKEIGKNFPVGLAGFPYVDYHLSFPYSVFLGPNGAQYNLPQMYWADIGTTVANVFAVTYEYNEIYRRPIFPLGQLWGKLSAASIEQFNMLANEYGATGVSWWDWQSAPSAYFSDITRTAPLLVSFTPRTPASVYRGSKGDLVIWAQEHLYGAGYKLVVDGQFGPQTQNAIKAFQAKHDLARTGVINGATWDALDRYTPVSVRWSRTKGVTKATIARGGKVAGHTGTLVEPVPSWMNSTRRRNELHGDPGAGRPRKAKF